MPITIDMAPRGSYMSVVATGVFELGQAQALTLHVLEACTRCGLAKVLVDLRAVTGPITVIDRYEYAEFVARHQFMMILAGRLRGVRMAYVDKLEAADRRRLTVAVGRRRGIDLMATNDMTEAVKWLEAPPAN